VWDARSGSLIWAAKDDPAEVLAVAFFPGTARIASGTADGVVKIRDARTGSVVQTLAAHAGGASSLVFSPDGQTLFAAEAHGGARVWNAHTGKLLQTYRAPASAIQSGLFTVDRRLNTVSMTTDGRVVGLCGSGENGEYTAPFQLWDVATGAVKRDFSDEKIHGRPTVLSPDGSVVATGGKSVKLYDAHTGKLLRELYGYLKRTQSITFSADGKVLVAGGSYGTTNLWDVSTGRHLATLFAFNDPQSGAPDDAWLACTYDGFYDGSPGVGRFLAWRVGEELLTAPSLSAMLHQPDRLTDALTVLPPRQRSQN
jgi:WD40 repeat protein